VQCNDGSCRVAKTDLSQLKCCVIASQKTDQEGNSGVVGLSVAETNFRRSCREIRMSLVHQLRLKIGALNFCKVMF
jgi:hypothetical protein